MSAALQRGWRKAARTLLQLAVGGALTAGVGVLTDGLSPNAKVLVLTGWTVLIALLQNVAETAGKLPVLLPSPGLVVGPVADVVVGTVDAVVEETGAIAGDVLDVAGDVVGEVVGQLDNDHEAGRLSVIVAVVIAAIVLMFVAADACIDDESEERNGDDLGQGVELVTSYDYDDGDGDEKSGNGSGECAGATAPCSDDDASPSFTDSPVEDSFNPVFCLPFSRCEFDDEEPVSPA